MLASDDPVLSLGCVCISLLREEGVSHFRLGIDRLAVFEGKAGLWLDNSEPKSLIVRLQTCTAHMAAE